MTNKAQQKHVVVIGCGFAGLNAVKRLSGYKNHQITVIDKTNHHLFQPLLYQVATAALSPGDIAMPIREIFRNLPNVKTIMANVVEVNKDSKTLRLENNEIVHFDVLIVGVGARHAYFGQSQWEPFAPGLKNLQDALHIREKILVSYETAERLEDFNEQAQYTTFVVIGGGPTGIEMAGAIAEIAHQSLKKDFRNVDPSLTKVILIEGGPQLLNGYPIKYADKAKQDLERMKVTVKLNAKVDEINQNGVSIGDLKIASKNIIWAAGNVASPILNTLQVEQDRQNRVKVEKDLSLKGYPDIFVIGDAAHATDDEAKVLAAIAPVAVQQGEYVGRIIGKNLSKDKRPPFRYSDKGMMATIGKYKALVLSGPIRCTGFIAWVMWCLVHIYFLIGYRSKLFVFSQWIFYFFRGQRNVRLIVKPYFRSKNEKE